MTAPDICAMNAFGCQTKEVALDAIDWTDETYRITTCRDASPLCRSISAVGLLQAPRVMEIKGEGRFRVVCGFLRLAACRRLGWEKVPVIELPADSPALFPALAAISDNSFSRALNPIETARALALLSGSVPGKKGFPAAAGSAGLPDHPGVVEKLLDLLNLPESVQEAVVTGDIPVVMGQALGRLSREAAERFGAIFMELKLGLNKQREVLALCEEIAILGDRDVVSVLSDPDVAAILSDPETDRSQKARALRFELKKKRYPMLSAAEAACEAAIRELKTGQGVQLIPPKDFEGDVFSLTLRFDSRQSLKDRIRSIEELPSAPALERLFQLSTTLP